MQFSNSNLYLILFMTILLYLELCDGKDQYVMPLSGGMKMSLQEDLCNVFNRPNYFATSVIVSVSLLGILFFGVLTAPFGYFFGIPSRKYVLGSVGKNEEEIDYPMIQGPRSLDEPDFFQRFSKLLRYELYLEDLFYMLDEEDDECRFLALCYAHGGIRHLPKWMVEIYKIISGKVQGIENEFKNAIENGLTSEKSVCSEKYKCSNPPFNLVIKTLMNFFHSNKNVFRKRKQEMYL